METKTEEDNSMVERILNNIEHLLYTDIHLKEFCIIPKDENKNKSPVLYQEHNIGLESWCVKYIYRYLYAELFKVRHTLKKNRLPHHETKRLNKLLIGAVLIHPDVSTFWNMRRELIDFGEIEIDKELLLIKLVLSTRSKSNEAFAYRKWILKRLLKNIDEEHVHFAILMINEEFTLTETAGDRFPNNYHAWTHRIWCIENIAMKSPVAESPEYLQVLLTELDFSMRWINRHVSEHVGFHHRQYLCNSIFKNRVRTVPHQINKYRCLVQLYIAMKSSNNCEITYLDSLLGKRENSYNANNPDELLKCYNYVYFFSLLLFDLRFFLSRLNENFPGHEAIWYHRRYVLFHLLKVAYEYHELPWKRNIKLNELYPLNLTDTNIINCDISDAQENDKLQDNGEKCPKLLKYELDKVESSNLYKMIIELEMKAIKENSTEKCGIVQRVYAKRHEKWLNYVFCFNRN